MSLWGIFYIHTIAHCFSGNQILTLIKCSPVAYSTHVFNVQLLRKGKIKSQAQSVMEKRNKGAVRLQDAGL
jgi:hypothetical protein